MSALAAFAMAGCLAVAPNAADIVFRDLLPAFPEAITVPPDTPVAFAPAPGARRTFHLPELSRLALRLGVNQQPRSEICFERPVAPPDPARLLAAMRQELPAANIEILDYSRLPLPEGKLEFPRAGLHPPALRTGAAAGTLWAGSILYAGNRRFHTWARVKVTVDEPRIIALTDLQPGKPVDAGQLRVETRQVFPDLQLYANSVEDIAGKWPRAILRAGEAVLASQLQSPREVLPGDLVTVVVRDGAAHLEFEGRAAAAGGRGDTIPVLNLTSHRRFPACIEGKGRVSVSSAPTAENP